ncbi:MAG TPA: peptidoglycan DD-metalloendopeptidase family protein [Burkholderiales bacterium]|nr:peptidoglycan DD-metalloendopeptidase family protein [Burkholderiales bacterium]
MTRAAKLACIVAVALGVGACAARRPAPVVDRGRSAPPPASSAQPAQQAVPPGFYMVKRGDTLYSIALDNGADYREVAQWNGLDDPTKISVGQVLRVKPPEERLGVQGGTSRVEVGTARGAGRVEARPLDSAPQQGRGDGTSKTEPKAVRLPYSKENAALLLKEERQADAEAIEFIWPAKGKILAGFAEPRSKGIDIEGKLGDPVVAAAAGRVTYSGSGIPGLGKLVVIKHDNGFITVYAHNKDNLVKEQQSVARGQKIAELGATDAERPKLHFQIRKGSAPVDPMRYLPAL